MHRLLPFPHALVRARRRRDEIGVWRIRAEAPIDGWTFDGKPIARGERWPARDAVHKLAAAFEAPSDWPLAETRLSLDAGGESLLTIAFSGGRRLQLGLDLNHTEFPLDAGAGRIEIEAVAKGPFGAPIREPRLVRAALIRIEPALDDFVRTLTLAIDLAVEIESHELGPILLEVAEDAMARVRLPTHTENVVGRESRYAAGYSRDPEGTYPPHPLGDDARASIAEAHAWLTSELRTLKGRYPPQGRIALVGHAHLDTAWLWPIEETRRKARRTFSTAAELVRRHPGFVFAQSFAEYYRQLEDDDPELLAAVQAEARAGRWEPVGGLWVEPDINMPCGESLVRQALYGQRTFERLFGARHSVAWLPDTFGFSPALPQILKGAGLTSLFTVKIGWSETNRFPHSRFWWEGIDGSQVFVQHMVSSDDNYNGQVIPRSLLRLWRNNTDKRRASELILPVGFGDGGGGPTVEMIAAQAALADFPLVPTTRFARVHDYFAAAKAEAEATETPTWVGELYLEFHRGVLTSQARTKWLHRRAERDLVAAEVIASAAHLIGGPPPASLEPHWRTLMVNQFHDILPGSSIGAVYARTEPELAGVVEAAGEVADAALSELATRLGGAGGDDALLVVNPDAAPRPLRIASATPLPGGQKAEDGWVLAGRESVPALSAAIVRSIADGVVSVEARALENRFVRVEFADDGTVTRLFDKRAGREALAGPGNQIWAYHDQPRVYDAWDIEEDYRRSGQVLAAERIGIVEQGPQRGALSIVRRLGHSTVTQSVRLWANSPRLDFHTKLDWHDRRVLLKARFPLAVRASHATYECAFGVQQRPTHRNTSWDAAKFEVAAHRFADLSEPGYGVALLNDGRYGHEARDNELSLTLLRAPTLPDRLADEGAHEFTYALLPHAGDWSASDVLAEAEDLNRPLLWRPATGEARTLSFIGLSGVRVGLGALKPAEDGDGLILRLYEPVGARGHVVVTPPPGWAVVGETDLLEDEIDAPSGIIRPFEIRSWRLRRSGAALRLASDRAAVAFSRRAPGRLTVRA
ncbi:MAG TPA: glycoside hydrolase family 38 C-terminal domain-containing protein [Caulobacteraceae bacterium]